MGMFNYKKHSAKESAELMSTSQKLAVYSNMASYKGLPMAKIVNFVGKISGNYFANKIDVNPPAGWRELTPSELGLPANSLDRAGYYTIASTVTGNRLISGKGPQVKLFGHFSEGKVTKISISWAGTNDFLDKFDYFHLNKGSIAPNMEPLLNSVKSYAIKNGLSGSDVLVTGYSLGGALTNIMAKNSQTLSNGFFKDSDYIGHASPLIYDNSNVVFNMGYENDAVYRILGDKNSFSEAIHDLKPFLVNPDKTYGSSADNIILFNGSYGSIFWSSLALSILNRPLGWKAHINGTITDAPERIANSSFYELTQKDSLVIVDALSALPRLFTWVRDKSKPGSEHYGKPAFIIGNEHRNLLKGNMGGDYIDARGGNDKIKPGKGADVIDGGAGTDTLILEGNRDNWNAYRLKDGTLFMHSKLGEGMKEAINIEKVAFEKEIRSLISPYTVENSALADHRFIIKSRNQNIHYKQHVEGSNKDDNLVGNVVFGKGGNDFIKAANNQSSLLHGGKGNDILIGKNGNDEIYGGEGNDLIYAGGGHNIVFGGVGNDVFSFDRLSKGKTEIRDFNKYANEKDILLFNHNLFDSAQSVKKSATQVGNDVHIYKHNVEIVLTYTKLAELDNTAIAIV